MFLSQRRRNPMNELTDYLALPQSSPQQAVRQTFGPPAQSPLVYSRPSQNRAAERSVSSARPPRRQEPEPAVFEVEGLGEIELDPSLSPEQQAQAIEELVGQRQQGGPSSLAEGGPLADWGRGGIETLTGFAQGAGHVFDNAAELAQGAYNQTLGRAFGTSDSATRANQQGQGFEGAANMLPEGNRAGRFGGEMAASALLTRGFGGPATQGAATGALLSEAENTGDFVRDIAVGGVTGWGADRLVRGAQHLLTPNVQQGARVLAGRGVRMTPGQVVGGRAHEVEDMATSFPYLGGAIEQGRRQSYLDFNMAGIRDIAAAYNAVPGVRQIAVPNEPGRRAVASVGNQLSNRYESLIPRLRLIPDDQIFADVRAASEITTNGDMTPRAIRQFRGIVQNQVLSRLGWNPNGPASASRALTVPGTAFAPRVVDGQSYRQIERGLSSQIARFGRSSDPDHQAMAEGFRQIQQAFQAALQRSNPAAADELAALNSGWANLVRVEGAAGSAGARAGIFSPAQFRQAVRGADNSVRGRAYARGEARMQALADAADEVLPPQYPDSGTAGRLNISMARPEFWLGAAGRRMYGPDAQQRISNFLLYPRGPASQAASNFLGALPAPQLGAGALNFNPIGAYMPPPQPRPY